jgi:hypothetical protein
MGVEDMDKAEKDEAVGGDKRASNDTIKTKKILR